MRNLVLFAVALCSCGGDGVSPLDPDNCGGTRNDVWSMPCIASGCLTSDNYFCTCTGGPTWTCCEYQGLLNPTKNCALAPTPDMALQVFQCCEMAKSCTFDHAFACIYPDHVGQMPCYCEPHAQTQLYCNGQPIAECPPPDMAVSLPADMSEPVTDGGAGD